MAAEFSEYFSQHYPPTVRALASACGDDEAASDAAQEAFARAYARWPAVSTLDRPQGWIFVTAMNHLRSGIRRQRRYHELVGRIGGHVDAEADPSTRLVVRDAVHLLPPRTRAAVVLRYVYDLKAADIADAMGCEEATVRSTLSAARLKLRAILAEPADDELEALAG